MPKGPSGKIVVDLGVELKRKLYAALALQGKNLKEWTTQKAREETTPPDQFNTKTPKEK
jgi:hypothetical protein